MMATAMRDLAVDQDWSKRPGVPMETEPQPMEGVHWKKPARQKPTTRIFKRVGLEELTPVFGTAQPPRGLSGQMRAVAYRIPESKAAHWGILLASDRVDAIEGMLIDSFTRKPYVGLFALVGLVGLGFGLSAGRAISKTQSY